MDDEVLNLIIGVIVLILIINTTAILSIASTLYGQDMALRVSGISGSPGSASSVNPETTRAATNTEITTSPASTRTMAPTQVTNKPVTQASESAKSQIISYVTIEPLQPQPTETHQIIQPNVPSRSTEGFVTIYSINNQSLTEAFPNVSFNIVNPPLIIEYSVIPFNITDIKNVEYKIKSKKYNETLRITRPYEGTWFTVIARDMDSGGIVAEDGVGKIWSFTSPKRLDIQNSGNFQFEFDGEFGYLTLTMKVKKEGNIN
jgi:hypothetical protein